MFQSDSNPRASGLWIQWFVLWPEGVLEEATHNTSIHPTEMYYLRYLARGFYLLLKSVGKNFPIIGYKLFIWIVRIDNESTALLASTSHSQCFS